jgi:hypothetical protein
LISIAISCIPGKSSINSCDKSSLFNRKLKSFYKSKYKLEGCLQKEKLAREYSNHIGVFDFKSNGETRFKLVLQSINNSLELDSLSLNENLSLTADTIYSMNIDSLSIGKFEGYKVYSKFKLKKEFESYLSEITDELVTSSLDLFFLVTTKEEKMYKISFQSNLLSNEKDLQKIREELSIETLSILKLTEEFL